MRTATYDKFKAEIGSNFCRVVNGEDGTFSSRCGDLSIRSEGGSVTLSMEAAKLLADALNQQRPAESDC